MGAFLLRRNVLVHILLNGVHSCGGHGGASFNHLVSSESPMLSVSPDITATCGQTVTLHCSVSYDGLVIKHLSWLNHNNKTVCSVNPEGKLHQVGGGANCSYADQRLTLQFVHTPLPESQGLHRYLCKLRSNKGFTSGPTTVELKGQRGQQN